MIFSLLPWLPKRPKEKNSCSKMWPIDQLYIELGLNLKRRWNPLLVWLLHNWKTRKWWVWLGWYWLWQKRVDRIHWKTAKNLQSFFFANNWEFSSVLLWRRIFRSWLLDNKLLGWGIHSDEVRQSNNYTVQYSRGEYNVENLKLIWRHHKNFKTHPKGEKHLFIFQ